jgi:hypothetical protein
MTLSESRPVKGIKEYFKPFQQINPVRSIELLQIYLVPEAEKK